MTNEHMEMPHQIYRKVIQDVGASYQKSRAMLLSVSTISRKEAEELIEPFRPCEDSEIVLHTIIEQAFENNDEIDLQTLSDLFARSFYGTVEGERIVLR